MKRKKAFEMLQGVTDSNVVVVTWHDTFSNDSWTDDEQLEERTKKPFLVRSVGYFALATKHHVVVVQNDCARNALHFGEVHIPYGMIQSIQILKEA